MVTTALSLTVQITTPNGEIRPLDDIKNEVIGLIVGICDGNMSEAARTLGIGRSTLYRKFPVSEIRYSPTEIAP